MLLGPIFSVEMLTGARRARYFVARVLYGLILLFAFWSVYSVTHTALFPGQVGDIGQVANMTAYFFRTFAVLQLVAVVLLGPAMAADTIAVERERRTIEYLFVADLSNFEIVLGKLAARFLQIICLILTGLPILALATLLGGIAPQALAVVFLITISTVLAVATLSIAISVWSARSREAVTRAYLAVFALLLVPPLLYSFRFQPGMLGDAYDTLLAPLNDHLLASNPFWILGSALFGASTTGTANAWQIVGTLVRNHLILSALAAISATVAVRRVHLRPLGSAPKRRRRLMRLRRPAAVNLPMLWKEIFAEPAASRLGLVGWLAIVLISLVVIGTCVYAFFSALTSGTPSRFSRSEYHEYTTTMGTLVSCGLLLLVATRSAAAVTSEKERDCWASLLSTPLPPYQIVSAKILGSIYAVRGALLILAIIWGMGVILDPTFLLAVPFLLGTLLTIALFASSLGVLFSLRCRSSVRSMGATLGVCLLLGGGYLFCCMPCMWGVGPSDGAEFLLAPCVPFLLAFPEIVYVSGGDIFRHDGTIVVAYGLGVIAYLVAAALIFVSSVSNFDELTGRVSGWPRGAKGTPPEIIIAEVVEED